MGDQGGEERRGGSWGGEEDGRRVGDTGCDEAVDLICSPAPSSSFSASLCHLCPLLPLLFVSPHLVSPFSCHFLNFLNSTSKNTHFLLLVAHCFIDFVDPFVPFVSSPRRRLHFYSFFISLGFFSPPRFPPYPSTYTSI